MHFVQLFTYTSVQQYRLAATQQIPHLEDLSSTLILVHVPQSLVLCVVRCRTVLDLSLLPLYCQSNLPFLSTLWYLQTFFRRYYNNCSCCGLSNVWSFFSKWCIFSITCEKAFVTLRFPCSAWLVGHGCTVSSDHTEDNKIGIQSLQST